MGAVAGCFEGVWCLQGWKARMVQSSLGEVHISSEYEAVQWMWVMCWANQESSQLTLFVNEKRVFAGLLQFCPWALNVAVQTAEKDGAWTDTVLCGWKAARRTRGNPGTVSFLAWEFVLSLDCGENWEFQKEAEVSSKLHVESSPFSLSSRSSRSTA